MAAGNRTENIQALIPNVGEWGGRLCGRRITHVLLLEKPAYGRCEAKQYAQREREEREREAQRGITLLTKKQQLQMNNNLCKRLQSHFI